MVLNGTQRNGNLVMSTARLQMSGQFSDVYFAKRSVSVKMVTSVWF